MPKPRALVPLMLAVPLALSLGLASEAAADNDPASTPVPTAEPVTPDTAQEFLDTTVPELIERHDGTGAGVSMVADGEIVASEGYGVADSVERTPIDPATTAMHTGSTTKSITAMTALQLVDEGQVDLQEDINTYLPDTVQIDDTHPGEPVTLHHLLTHTGGFEENMSSYFVDGPEHVLPLEEHLATIDVARLQPPGRFTSYSNYGLALAGLIVQEVSGVPFEDYVEQNVLEPLGMNNTAFGQADVVREQYDVATQHDVGGEPESDFYMESVPAGVSVASVDDMARFMLSLINKGELDGERVLSEESTELMLSRQDGNAPEVSGAGYGTWEVQSEPMALGHKGDWIGAHARYVVVPELGIGIYVTVNNAEGEASAPEFPNEDLRNAIQREFLDQFAPETGTREGVATPEEDLGRYTGTYVTTRTSESDLNQVMTIPKSLRVSDNGDGTLSITGTLAVDDRWLPAGDGLFVAENGRDTMGFMEEDGEIIALSTQRYPEEAYAPVGFLEQPMLRLGAAGVALLVLLSVTVSWRRPKDAVTLVARVVASLTAAGAVTTVGLFVYGAVDNTRFISWLGGGGFGHAMQITCALGLATVGMAVASWIRGWWSTAYRVYYSVVALAAVVFGSVGLMYGVF